VQDSHSQVDIKMLAEAADVNGIYEEALDSLRAAKFSDVGGARGGAKAKPGVGKANKPKVMSEREKEQAAIDYYADVRTNVLLTWVLSNVSVVLYFISSPISLMLNVVDKLGCSPPAHTLWHGFVGYVQPRCGCIEK
jgi:chitin synthase